MSWMYKEQGSERITNKEILLIREELKNIIWKENIINTNLIDQHGNTNLLLPNFMKEKEDNGDIDIFLYYVEDYFNPEMYINLINNTGNVLDINKNDHTWSIFYFSPNVGKKVQIDLHIIENTFINCTSYFNYFRVPYFFYVIWMFQKNLGFKLWQNWFYIKVEDDLISLLQNDLIKESPNIVNDYLKYWNFNDYYILLENISYLDFMENYFQIKKEDFYNISSYVGIANVINNTEIVNYNWIKDIKAKYIKRIKNNSKLQKIIPNIKIGEEDLNILKEKIRRKFILDNKNILIQKIIFEIEKRKELKLRNQRKTELFKIFFNIPESSFEIMKEIDKNLIDLIANNIEYYEDIVFFLEKANIKDFQLLNDWSVQVGENGINKLKEFAINNNIQFDEEQDKYVLNWRYNFTY